MNETAIFPFPPPSWGERLTSLWRSCASKADDQQQRQLERSTAERQLLMQGHWRLSLLTC